MPNASVLVVGADTALVETVREVIDLIPGCQYFAVSQIEEALAFLADSSVTLAIYHATASTTEPLDRLLHELEAQPGGGATLVISDDNRPEFQLKMLERGVADCLIRPLDLPRLSFLIDSLTLRGRYGASAAPAASQSAHEAAPPTVPQPAPQTTSPAAPPNGKGIRASGSRSSGMDHFEELVRKVARQDSTILLSGETGVGKTHLARVIHNLSPRQSEPFLTVSCASLAESLLESELFGHSKGSFTGADAARTGRFEAAGTGTLLLDEIDSLPLALQKKLLQAVDERVFEPVGSNRSQPLRARLLVATNRNLPDEIAAGRFRADLYYRLNIIEIQLPPLRQRREAVPAIAESYLRECAERNGRPVPRISAEAWKALVAFDWPGNIRELRNAIARALAFCDDRVIGLADLPEAVQLSVRRVNPSRSVAPGPTAQTQPAPSNFAQAQLSFHPAGAKERIPAEAAGRLDLPLTSRMSALAQARAEGEIECIKSALERAGNNRTRASAALGISRVALYKKMRRHGLFES